MKRIIALLTALALVPVISTASPFSNPSEMSVYGGISMVGGSLLVLTSPFLIISNVADNSEKGGKVKVEVTNPDGAKDHISLPAETVAKANLKAGDRLTMKPTKAGGILSKNDVPVAYVVTPENSNLSRSHELAK